MSTVEDVFWRAHRDLPREAPGSEATTAVLLGLARRSGALPESPRIVDLGCGTGPATVPLVRATGGTALAVDLHGPFLAALRTRAAAAGVGARVRTVAADPAARAGRGPRADRGRVDRAGPVAGCPDVLGPGLPRDAHHRRERRRRVGRRLLRRRDPPAPESDWANYHAPLGAALDDLARHGAEYGYTGYVLVPRN